MALMYQDMVQLFPRNSGFSDPSLQFLTVTSYAHIAQPKGIFIPLYQDSGELKDAIDNGAIAVLWDELVPLPSYTPNSFLVFYDNDLLKGLKMMVELYRNKQLKIEAEQIESTKFYFLPENSLNKRISTYDLAVMVNELDRMLKNRNDGRGE